MITARKKLIKMKTRAKNYPKILFPAIESKRSEPKKKHKKKHKNVTIQMMCTLELLMFLILKTLTVIIVENEGMLIPSFNEERKGKNDEK